MAGDIVDYDPAAAGETLRCRLADLPALVGKDLGPGRWFEFTQAQVDEFAHATGDHQWIHTDSEEARRGPYNGPIAHGFLVISAYAGEWGKLLEITDATSLINYGIDRVRFIQPVPVPSRVRLTLAVEEVRPTGNGCDLHLNATFELEGAERPACVMHHITRVVADDLARPLLDPRSTS